MDQNVDGVWFFSPLLFVFIPEQRMNRQQIPLVHWLASLSKYVISGFKQESLSQTKQNKTKRNQPTNKQIKKEETRAVGDQLRTPNFYL